MITSGSLSRIIRHFSGAAGRTCVAIKGQVTESSPCPLDTYRSSLLLNKPETISGLLAPGAQVNKPGIVAQETPSRRKRCNRASILAEAPCFAFPTTQYQCLGNLLRLTLSNRSSRFLSVCLAFKPDGHTEATLYLLGLTSASYRPWLPQLTAPFSN